jgi:hypothetical protein
LLLTDPLKPFGDLLFESYDDDLLHMAHDLAARLLPAFENTTTGIPHPRVGKYSRHQAVHQSICLSGLGLYVGVCLF